MNFTFTHLDLFIIVGYILAIVAYGFYHRKAGSSEDYFLAGRNMPWYVIGISMFVQGWLPMLDEQSTQAFLQRAGDAGRETSAAQVSAVAAEAGDGGLAAATGGSGPTSAGSDARSAAGEARVVPRPCPRCHQASLVREEGCWLCRNCGFSRCG